MTEGENEFVLDSGRARGTPESPANDADGELPSEEVSVGSADTGAARADSGESGGGGGRSHAAPRS
ncbi:MAG TPA: hypothetical protein VF591_09535 [Pyrinomonadaceae bacterium]|jgi:hypothetical protein